MSLLFFEGFNHDWEDTSKYPASGVWEASSGRNGTGALYIDDNAPRNALISGWEAVPEGTEFYVGFAWKQHDNGADYADITFREADGSTIINMDIDGNGTPTIGTITGATPSNVTWYYYEFIFTTGGTPSIEFFIDGVSQGTDTTTAMSGDFAQIYFDSWYKQGYWVDDLYVADSNGTVNNSRLGDVHVVSLVPTGHGTHKDGVGSDGDSTDNHLLVDEYDVDTADYVSLTAVSDRDSYTCANLGAGEVPLGAKVSINVGQGDALLSEVDGFIRLSSTDYDASDPALVSSSFSWEEWIWDSNPNTSAAWAEDDLDGVEYGFERTG